VNTVSLADRYLELQQYVGWTPDDALQVRLLGPVVEPALPELIEDFYDEIQRHPEASKVITGGQEQVERLKKTLTDWLRELFSGNYDEDYVIRRWRVGNRHVEIGLNQVYTNMALSRLRTGLERASRAGWTRSAEELSLCMASLHKLLDLDLAIIEDAYQAEYLRRQRLVERQQMRNALEDREARLQAILDAAVDAIITCDESGLVESVNPAAERMFGVRMSNLIGANVRQLVPELRIALEARADGTGEQRPSPVPAAFSREMTGRRQDGTKFPAHVSVFGVTLAGRKLRTAIIRDISDLKQAEAKTVQSERLAAMGKAMAGLVHESRNALQRSQAGLERLTRRVADAPGVLELIQSVQRAQDDLHRLYEEVREYAAPVRIQPQLYRLDLCLHEAWEHLRIGCDGRRVQLSETHSTSDARCEIDPFAIRQVFRNVLENALAACADPVRIEVRYADDEAFNGTAALSIAIRDNGPGLSAEQLTRMFEEFYTTKTRGTGLGLPIARRLVEAHGGRIAAASPPDQGAEITIVLPRTQP